MSGQETKPDDIIAQLPMLGPENGYHVLHVDMTSEPDPISTQHLISEENNHSFPHVDVKTEHSEHSEAFTQSDMSDQTKCTCYLVDVKTELADTMLDQKTNLDDAIIQPQMSYDQSVWSSQEINQNDIITKLQMSGQKNGHNALQEDMKSERGDIPTHNMKPEEQKHECPHVDVKLEHSEHSEHSEAFTQSDMSDLTKCTCHLTYVKTEPADTMSTTVTVKSDPNDLTPTLSNTTCQTPVSGQIQMKLSLIIRGQVRNLKVIWRTSNKKVR